MTTARAETRRIYATEEYVVAITYLDCDDPCAPAEMGELIENALDEHLGVRAEVAVRRITT